MLQQDTKKTSNLLRIRGLKNGGKGRSRTGDTRIFSPLLYQLSYPANQIYIYLAYLEGFEPPAFWSVAKRSIQLSYRYTV